jgi:hypothetical protein
MPDDTRLHPLNAGSRRMARDPAQLYEEKERGTCTGCAHIIIVIVAGASTQACGCNKTFGTRCRHYAERALTKS